MEELFRLVTNEFAPVGCPSWDDKVNSAATSTMWARARQGRTRERITLERIQAHTYDAVIFNHVGAVRNFGNSRGEAPLVSNGSVFKQSLDCYESGPCMCTHLESCPRVQWHRTRALSLS